MRTTVVVLFVSAFALAPLAASAAEPTRGAKYLAKIPREDTRDNTIRLKVSRDGKSLDLIGPHEACNDAFNPVPGRTYPEIDDVKIRKGGKFKASRTYEVESDTGAVTYMWEVAVRGRFVSEKKAKGTLEWHMRHGGERAVGGERDCGANTADFVAKRGVKWPGYLNPEGD
jgi:hypothetical protein